MTNLELQKNYDKLVENSKKRTKDIKDKVRAATVAEALRLQKAADWKKKTKTVSHNMRKQTLSQLKRAAAAQKKKRLGRNRGEQRRELQRRGTIPPGVDLMEADGRDMDLPINR